MATQGRTRKKPRYNWKMLGWGLTAQIIPACFVLFLSLYLIPKTSIMPELGIPLSIAFGALGATIHYLALKRGMRFRVVWSVVFLLFTAGVAFGLHEVFRYRFDQMVPCPVCGFVTLGDVGENAPIAM